MVYCSDTNRHSPPLPLCGGWTMVVEHGVTFMDKPMKMKALAAYGLSILCAHDIFEWW